MERARRLTQLWNWLPAFRAVAETEHLPRASESLHVSPSALSRTIRLLESEVGQPLFDRVGRSLVLNAAGERFLSAIRDSMRIVHTGLEELERAQHVGPAFISVSETFAPVFVLPALDALRSHFPLVTPILSTLAGQEAISALKRGVVDLAVLDGATADPAVHIDAIATLKHDVCVAPDHPLVGSTPAIDDLALEPFVCPIADEHGITPDHWPSDQPRRVVMRVEHRQIAIDACRQSGLLVVLPRKVARYHGLVPLDVPGVGESTLSVARRTTLGTAGRAEIIAAEIQRSAARVTDREEISDPS